MPHTVTRSIVGLLAAWTMVAGAGATAGAADAVQSPTRTVYVSVSDKKGTAVTDMLPADFEVKVGGKVQQVVSAEPATTPLRIALIVADQGTGAFQQGLAHFMQNLLGHAEFALISVIKQPETVVDYSPSGATLSAGLSRMGRRGREIGAQLMEAIDARTKDVAMEGRRPVIVVLRLGGENPSQLSGDQVRDDLRKSGAILYVISTAGADRGAPSQARGTDAMSMQQGQLHDADLADAATNLAQVLGDGAKESGGHHDQVISTTFASTVEQLADELQHQYEVTYTMADGVKPGDKLSVSSKRKGTTAHAPQRLPD